MQPRSQSARSAQTPAVAGTQRRYLASVADSAIQLQNFLYAVAVRRRHTERDCFCKNRIEVDLPKIAQEIGIARQTLWRWLKGDYEPRAAQERRIMEWAEIKDPAEFRNLLQHSPDAPPEAYRF